MITKLALLAAISLASAAMAIGAQTFDAFNQSQTVRLYDAAMTTKNNTTDDLFNTDPVVSIRNTPTQYCTNVVGIYAANVLPFTQNQTVLNSTCFTNIQAILAETFKPIILTRIDVNPPLDLELTYKPSYYSFFPSSFGGVLDILTVRKNLAFVLTPLAMFVLGHISSHK
jgi:hypothetical protein